MSDTLRDVAVNIRLGGDIAQSLAHIDEQIGHTTETLKGMGEAFVAALGLEKLHAFVEGQAKLAAAVKDTSERLGVDSQELQKFGYAAEMSGSSSEQMAASIKLLQRTMSQAASGGGHAAGEFEKYHISIKNADGTMRDATDVMYDIADALAKMPEGAERTGLAMKLMGRGGASMIGVLGQGGHALAALTEEAKQTGGVFSKEYLEAADKADDASTRLSWSWKGMKSAIAAQLFPAFTSFTDAMSKHISKGKDMLAGTTAIRAGFLALGAAGAIKLIPMLLRLIQAFAGVEAGAGLVATALGLIETLGIIAAVAVLVGLFDDLWGMFEGKDSLIGDTIDAMYGFGETQQLIEDLNQAWDEFMKALDSLGVEIPGIADILSSVLGAALIGVAGGVRSLIQLLTAGLTAMTRFVEGAAFVKQTYDDIKAGKNVDISARMKALGDFASTAAAEFGSTVMRGGGLVGDLEYDPKSGGYSVGGGGRHGTDYNGPGKIINNHITNNVHGVSNPKEAAKHVEKGTRTALDDFQSDNSFEAFGIPDPGDEG